MGWPGLAGFRAGRGIAAGLWVLLGLQRSAGACGGWWAPWPQIAVGNTNSLVFKDLSGGGCNFPHGPSKHVSRLHVRAQLLFPLRTNHNVGGGRGREHGGSKPLLARHPPA